MSLLPSIEGLGLGLYINDIFASANLQHVNKNIRHFGVLLLSKKWKAIMQGTPLRNPLAASFIIVVL